MICAKDNHFVLLTRNQSTMNNKQANKQTNLKHKKQTNLKHIKCFDDLCQGQSPAKAPTVPAFYLCTPHSAPSPSPSPSPSPQSSPSPLSLSSSQGQRLFCMLCFCIW